MWSLPTSNTESSAASSTSSACNTWVASRDSLAASTSRSCSLATKTSTDSREGSAALAGLVLLRGLGVHPIRLHDVLDDLVTNHIPGVQSGEFDSDDLLEDLFDNDETRSRATWKVDLSYVTGH